MRSAFDQILQHYPYLKPLISQSNPTGREGVRTYGQTGTRPGRQVGVYFLFISDGGIILTVTYDYASTK